MYQRWFIQRLYQTSHLGYRIAELGGVYVNPASHGEGRFVAPEECIKELFANGQVATQYVNEQGQPTMDEEWNVNGSYYAIEGITSPDGRCLGKMAHIERKGYVQ